MQNNISTDMTSITDFTIARRGANTCVMLMCKLVCWGRCFSEQFTHGLRGAHSRPDAWLERGAADDTRIAAENTTAATCARASHLQGKRVVFLWLVLYSSLLPEQLAWARFLAKRWWHYNPCFTWRSYDFTVLRLPDLSIRYRAELDLWFI